MMIRVDLIHLNMVVESCSLLTLLHHGVEWISGTSNLLLVSGKAAVGGSDVQYRSQEILAHAVSFRCSVLMRLTWLNTCSTSAFGWSQGRHRFQHAYFVREAAALRRNSVHRR